MSRTKLILWAALGGSGLTAAAMFAGALLAYFALTADGANISAAQGRDVERNVNDGLEEQRDNEETQRQELAADGQRHRGEPGEGTNQGRPREAKGTRVGVSKVRAHDRRRGREGFGRNRYHGVKLARWCVTEDGCVLWPEGKGSEKWPACGTGGALSAECKAIVEVAEHNVRSDHESWDDTLAFISPRVMNDDAEPRPGTRQHWLKTLPAEGDAMPDGWRDCRDQKPCDGDWRNYSAKWERLRDEMIEWWLTGPHDVCEGEPLAEGTVEEAERIAIPIRGFEEYTCKHEGEFVARLWIGGPPL